MPHKFPWSYSTDIQPFLLLTFRNQVRTQIQIPKNLQYKLNSMGELPVSVITGAHTEQRNTTPLLTYYITS